MFVDKVILTLIAGSGGNGVVAWRREKFVPKGGPCGGNGGYGGSIFLQTDQQVTSLEGFRNRREIKAKNGAPGGYNYCTGKKGQDIILKIPPGTLVKDRLTGTILYDFIEKTRIEKICKGGKGGKGNAHFKSATHQAPDTCTPGDPGVIKEVELELKLIADIGLVGMPNAGKSSLMSCITPVEVKIGAYPFTTLFPNLGYLNFPDQSRILVADIPGIIEGAHTDRGLGLEFLRHIERSSVLIYVIDVSGIEERDPLDDFQMLQNEISAYQPELMNKPSLIVLNKIDIEGSLEKAAEFREKNPNLAIIEVSAETRQGIPDLIQAIFELFSSFPSTKLSDSPSFEIHSMDSTSSI